MTGDNDKPFNVTEGGRHELQEKAVVAGVDGDQIGHQTLPNGQAQELEERKAQLAAAAAFLEAKRKEREAAPPAKSDPRRNQGSVVAVVVIVGVLLLLVVGFIVLMWRLSKSETEVKKYLLELTDH